MRGTLHGDFSRGPDPGDREDRIVHLQQGRVLLDADWNAQAAWIHQRLETGVADLLGTSGGPAGEAGFGVEVQPALDLASRRFAVIGAAGGFELPGELHGVDREALGFALEVQLSATRNGAIVGLGRLGGDSLWSLALHEGRLRFTRPGVGGGVLESEPVDLGDRLHHVTVVGDATRTTIYLDGVAAAAQEFGLLPDTGTVLMLVGARYEQGEARALLAGKLAGLRLWHTTLRPEQVARMTGRRELAEKEIMAGLGLDSRALVGEWRFEEGFGREIIDHTAHCNHAELHGGAPAWLPLDPHIGAGRYYVDGVLCESAASTPFDEQPQLMGETFPMPDGRSRGHLFYLDVWERTVSAAENPALRETALGGADTTVRSRAVTQVKVLEIPAEEVSDGQAGITWQNLLTSNRRRGQMRVQRQQIGTNQLDNCLYRVEIHDPGYAWQAEAVREAARQAQTAVPTGGSDDHGAIEVALATPWVETWYEGQTVAVVPLDEQGDPLPAAETPDGSESTDDLAMERVLATIRQPDTAQDRLWLAGDLTSVRDAASLALVPIATCKWSRTNGAVTYAIARVDPSGKQLWTMPSARSLLEVPQASWLEVLDEPAILAGRRPPLSQVVTVDAQESSITLDASLGARASSDQRLFLRLWDQRSTNEVAVTTTGVLIIDDRWQVLENGIEAQFAAGQRMAAGDYWWIASRTLGGDEIWPLDPYGEPIWRSPNGVEHRLAPLAMLSYESEGFRLLDLRQIFQPLARGGLLAGGTVDGSLRVNERLSVGHGITVDGRLRATELLGPVCSTGAVSAQALAEGAVTPQALAPAVGIVPAGFALLARQEAAAEGYAWQGAEMTLPHSTPVWRDRAEIPGGPPGPMVSVALGGAVYSFLASGEVWVFDPASLAWERRQPQPSMRRAFVAVALGERIYLIGGLDAADRPVDDVLAYEPERDVWHDCRPIPHARGHAAAAAADDWIHVFGGMRRAIGPDRVTHDHRVYDPDTDAWHARRPLPAATAAASAATFEGAISVVGGEERWLRGRWGRVLTDQHLRFLHSADRWLRSAAPLPTPRRGARLAVVYDRLWLVGGHGVHGALGDCVSWDITLDAWRPGPPLHEVIDAPGVAAVAGELIVTGAQRAGGQGALVESCRVVTRYLVHERLEAAEMRS